MMLPVPPCEEPVWWNHLGLSDEKLLALCDFFCQVKNQPDDIHLQTLKFLGAPLAMQDVQDGYFQKATLGESSRWKVGTMVHIKATTVRSKWDSSGHFAWLVRHVALFKPILSDTGVSMWGICRLNGKSPTISITNKPLKLHKRPTYVLRIAP